MDSINQFFDRRRLLLAIVLWAVPVGLLVGAMLALAHASEAFALVTVGLTVVLLIPPVLLFSFKGNATGDATAPSKTSSDTEQ